MTGIATSRAGAVGIIVLDRPAQLNALGRAGFEALAAALASFAADRSVRALVLTGRGRAFCAGADLTDPMMGGELPPEARGPACLAALAGPMNGAIRAIRSAPVPTVAAVNGIAAGGGVGLALAADIVLAAETARFVLPFVPRLGIVPDLGTSWHLARHLGRARALALALTGEALAAGEAAAQGLIWRAVPDAALEAEALALAQRLAAGPMTAAVAARRLMDAALDRGLEAQLDAEAATQAALVGGAEAVEALAAFAARRPPDFSAIPRAE